MSDPINIEQQLTDVSRFNEQILAAFTDRGFETGARDSRPGKMTMRHTSMNKYFRFRFLLCLTVSIGLAVLLLCLPAAGAGPGRIPGSNVTKRVLILNSFHIGYIWTDNTLSGINDVFRSSDLPVDAYEAFMDLKRIPYSESYILQLKELYKIEYKNVRFDAILANDNDAFEFLRKYRDELFPGVPVVFSAIKLALKIRPAARNIVVVTDNTTTGRAHYSAVHKIEPLFSGKADFQYISVGDYTFEEAGRKLGALTDDSVVLLLHHFMDKTGATQSVQEGTRFLTSICPVPSFALIDFRVGNGALGGNVIYGSTYGQAAAKMVLDILHGVDVQNIPVSLGPNQYMFNYDAMRRFHVSESELPEGSMILNKPFSLLDKYKYYILVTGFVFLVLCSLVAVMALMIRRRKKIEESLRISEGRVSLAMQAANMGLYDLDLKTGEAVVNSEYALMLGYDPAEFKETNAKWIERLHPDDREHVASVYSAYVNGEIPEYKVEFRQKTKDGQWKWLLSLGRIMERDANGNPVRMLGTHTDITESKKIEEELRKSQDRLKLAHQTARLGSWEWDLNTNELYWAEGNYRIHGIDPKVTPSYEAFIQVVDPAEHEYVNKAVADALAGSNSFNIDYTCIRPDNGEKVAINSLADVIRDSSGKAVKMVGTVQDITERKHVEKALQKSEELLNATGAMAHVGGWEIDLFGNTLAWTKETFLIHELSPDRQPDVAGAINFYHADDREMVASAVEQSIASGLPFDFEARLITMRGNQIWVRASGQPILQEGKVTGVRGSIQNITERKQEEAQLADRIQFIESIVNLTPDILYIYDIVDQKNVYSNDGIQKVLGYSVIEISEMSSRILTLLMHPDDLNIYLQETMLRYAIAKDNEPIIHSYRMKHRNGEWRWLYSNEIIYKRETDGSPRQIFGMVHDITESRLAEEQMQRSLKQKEVMLKEIHHRVKNNMQVIYSLLELQANREPDKAVRSILKESRNRVSSMALVHEKLYNSEDLAHIDFREYLQSLVAGIADTYKRNDVVFSVDMEPVALDVNIGIPCGLIVNELMSNSLKHAFPEGREGSIRLGINKNSEGKYILFVQDNGIGFPGEVDFCNTKSLGLKLVNVLTKQIHGTIELSKEEGTKFIITFPGTSSSK